jgi:hypothetical protein
VEEREHAGMGPALASLLVIFAVALGAILVAAVHFWGF